MKTFILIFAIFAMTNAVAAERIILQPISPFGRVLAETVCLGGYLFSIVRTNSQITSNQIYRPGKEADNYYPQPVRCRK